MEAGQRDGTEAGTAVAALDYIEVTNSGWALFGVAVVGNLGLAGLSILVMARTGRVRPAIAHPPTPITIG